MNNKLTPCFSEAKMPENAFGVNPAVTPSYYLDKSELLTSLPQEAVEAPAAFKANYKL